MKEFKQAYKVRLYNEPDEMQFPTNRKYWLGLVMCEDEECEQVFDITKKQYDYINECLSALE